jgi:hypothetical protein
MYGPIKYMTLAAGATTTGGPIWLAPDSINNWQMSVVTGTLTGTFTFETSNDPRARQTASATDQAAAKWTDITATLTQGISNPSASAVDFVAINKATIPWAGSFLRMKYTHTSGSGSVDAYFTGMSS